MSSSLTSAPPATPPFVCEHRFSSNEACRDEPFYKAQKDKDGERHYCVLHYPGEEKSTDFSAALRQRLMAGNYNFRYFWFPEKPNFGRFTFGREADFTRAVFHAGADFRGAKFSVDVYFYSTVFQAEADFDDYSLFSGDAYFHYAVFETGATFRFATFTRLSYFRGATFSALADFEVVTFSGEADFTAVKFRGLADFSYTRISDYITFSSEEVPAFDGAAFLDFQFANIEKPERVSFRTLRLRPHWFVNVDARKFDLSNVDWSWREISLKKELEELSLKRVATPHRVLSIACRNLAINAEENHRYDEASSFRFWAMDARRRERAQGFRPVALGWWYWLASGYGERTWQAALALFLVWFAAAVLYTQVGFMRWEPRVASEREAAEATRDDVGAPLRWQRALTYSLGVMTLQKPEPRPATNAAQALVMSETILGPVQAALLALAIRRKFMR